MNKTSLILIGILILVLCALSRQCGYKAGMSVSIEKVDSVYVYDSIPRYDTITIPVPIVEVRNIPSVIDTMAVLADYYSSKTYNIEREINDVKFSFSPIVFKNTLSDDFTMKVQNMRPIEFSTYQHVKQKPKRIGIGVQVGYGVNQNGFTPYVGIGISYNVLRF